MNSKAIVFCCNWSAYPGLQLSRNIGNSDAKNYQIIVNMCSGRVSPEIILNAFHHEAAGVMIATCPPEKCEHDANYKTLRRVLLLKKVLAQFGIEPERVRMEWIDKGEAQQLQIAIDDFMEELQSIGPIQPCA